VLAARGGLGEKRLAAGHVVGEPAGGQDDAGPPRQALEVPPASWPYSTNGTSQSSNVWPGWSASEATPKPLSVPVTWMSSMTGGLLSGPLQVRVAGVIVQSVPTSIEYP